jgi:hypothetical protein
MGSSVVVVDVAVLRGTHSAQEHSYPMPALLKTNTCSTMVSSFACAFRKEEPRSTHGCLGDEYATTIDGPYVQEGVTSWPVAPIEHFPIIAEADGRCQVRWIHSHARQIYPSVEAIRQAPAMNRRPC